MNNSLHEKTVVAVSDAQPLSIVLAGESANRADDYLFADYRQRRVKKTPHTQMAALLRWVQYLVEAGMVAKLLAEAGCWAWSHFRLSAVKVFARLAAKACVICADDCAGPAA
jgi:hypothetical protein